mmetsp:Transcript_49444/g.148994  ORF Transcript_49444/g.148994 Transcript_49444/m.148994 type:complete len:231 (-) Transcript_49444:1645-2337(-)
MVIAASRVAPTWRRCCPRPSASVPRVARMRASDHPRRQRSCSIEIAAPADSSTRLGASRSLLMASSYSGVGAMPARLAGVVSTEEEVHHSRRAPWSSGPPRASHPAARGKGASVSSRRRAFPRCSTHPRRESSRLGVRKGPPGLFFLLRHRRRRPRKSLRPNSAASSVAPSTISTRTPPNYGVECSTEYATGRTHEARYPIGPFVCTSGTSPERNRRNCCAGSDGYIPRH